MQFTHEAPTPERALDVATQLARNAIAAGVKVEIGIAPGVVTAAYDCDVFITEERTDHEGHHVKVEGIPR
jgi:hypothetical protein